MGCWTYLTAEIAYDPELIKRWDEYLPGLECAYVVEGLSGATMVCGAPSDGAYCDRHLEHIRAGF